MLCVRLDEEIWGEGGSWLCHICRRLRLPKGQEGIGIV